MIKPSLPTKLAIQTSNKKQKPIYITSITKTIREKRTGVFSQKNMKPLPSSLREKKRYIAFQVMEQISQKKAKTLIMERLSKFLGEVGMAKAGIMFLKDWKNNKGIIKTNASEVDKIKAGLALVKEITVKSIKTSGTLKKIRIGG